MSPLRILHVTPYSENAWAYGGIPRVVSALARAQVRGGHMVTVAATDVLDRTRRLAPALGVRPSWPRRWHERSDGGFEVVIFQNVCNRIAYRWQFYQPIGLGRFLQPRARDFDLAHLHACHNLPTAIAASVLRRAGVPYVVQPNGTAGRIEQRQAAKAVFDALFARRFLEDAAAVVAVSQAERRMLAAAGVDSGRCHSVANPLTQAPARVAEPGTFRQRLGLSPDVLVLFLGALSPRKHPAILVEAVAALTDARVQVVFAGPDRGAGAATRRAVRRHGMTGRVYFAGLLAGDERFAALADADVVVYASSDEVFGLAALEALQAGTPVIVGNDGGCGEVVAAIGGGLTVAPCDPAALSAALEEILRSLPAWKKTAAIAGAAAEERFHPDAVWTELERVYRGAIGSGNEVTIDQGANREVVGRSLVP